MTDKTQPEALRLDLSIDVMDTFTDYQQEELGKAAAELRRQHARIAELEARVQELGAMARENRSRRIVELEAQLEAVGAGGVHALSAAPAGWKLVPVEPTKEMVAAACREHGYPGGSRAAYVLGYKSMLAASPTPPAEPQAAPKAAPAWADQAVIEYRYAGGTHWCPLGPAERMKPDFQGVYRLQGGVFPVEQAAPKAAPGEPDPADIIAGALQISRGHAIEMMREALEAEPQQGAQEPCPTCAALARTVMLDQTSFDRKPDCYGIRQITDDEGIEEWEDIRTSPDVAREEANDMMATGRGEIYEVVPLWTTPQHAPQPAPAPLSDDVVKDAARWRWLSEHIGVAWNEGKFTSLVRIVSDNNRTALNASIDRMMTGDWSDAAIAAHGGNKL